MRVLVDTSVDSGLGVPRSAERLWAERWLGERGPIPVSAVTVFERTYGFERAIAAGAATAWTERLAAYETAVVERSFYDVLPWDAESALVAGRLLHRAPFPPDRRPRRARARIKTDARRGWLLDLLIGAQAATWARAVLTRNADDFEIIAGLLEDPFHLTVLRFPEEAEAAFDR